MPPRDARSGSDAKSMVSFSGRGADHAYQLQNVTSNIPGDVSELRAASKPPRLASSEVKSILLEDTTWSTPRLRTKVRLAEVPAVATT